MGGLKSRMKFYGKLNERTSFAAAFDLDIQKTSAISIIPTTLCIDRSYYIYVYIYFVWGGFEQFEHSRDISQAFSPLLLYFSLRVFLN